jgi:hypothetical protein
MNVGMLWFDNDPKTDVADKVERAATYYQQKYGQTPTVCFVHPSMLPGQGVKIDVTGFPRSKGPTSVEIRPHRSVAPNHFWIGINQTI